MLPSSPRRGRPWRVGRRRCPGADVGGASPAGVPSAGVPGAGVVVPVCRRPLLSVPFLLLEDEMCSRVFVLLCSLSVLLFINLYICEQFVDICK